MQRLPPTVGCSLVDTPGSFRWFIVAEGTICWFVVKKNTTGWLLILLIQRNE
jgi:hypothetical protein